MTQQYSITRSTLLAALTIASMAATSTEAFQMQPPVMVASIGSSRAVSSSSSSTITQLNYVVDRGTSTTSAASIGIEKRKTSKKKAATTITTKTVVTQKNDNDKDNHGYIVANHDNERSFWLHALQNLEPSPQSPSSKQSLWTKIACAYGPSQLREACATIQQNDALLVRVGDTDLDIALAVPADFWDVTLHMNENVVSTTTGSRKNRQIVTIRVDFPEGSSFDKDAFTFEDELTAVIGQVRLLEQHANEKLSCSEELV